MKRILSITVSLTFAILLTSAISIRETPQDPPRGKKGEKHIKMIKVSDNGKKMELDTVIEADEVLVWNGDTINDGKKMKWVSKGDFDMDFDIDDLDVDVDFDFDDLDVDMDFESMNMDMDFEFDNLEMAMDSIPWGAEF